MATATPAQPSFDDWKSQLVDTSVEGGVLGNTFTPEAWDQLKGHGLYTDTTAQLTDDYLQQMYGQGLTPQQVLYGQTGKPYSGAPIGTAGYTGNPNEAPSSFGTALYNPSVYNKGSQVSYDPRYGAINTSGTKEDMLDKVGDFTPAVLGALGAAVTLNPAMLGADFAGGLGSVGSWLFKGAEGLMQGNKLDPLSLAGSALGSFGGALNLPANLQAFVGPALRAATGGGFNPIQLALSLAKSGGK